MKKYDSRFAKILTKYRDDKHESKKKKNASRVISCVVNQCLHFTKTRLRSKVALRWLPNIADFSFFPLDLSRTWKGSSGEQFRIPIPTPWRVRKDTCNSVVKILWDSQLFRKREVHPFFVKSDWTESYLEEITTRRDNDNKDTYL